MILSVCALCSTSCWTLRDLIISAVRVICQSLTGLGCADSFFVDFDEVDQKNLTITVFFPPLSLLDHMMKKKQEREVYQRLKEVPEKALAASGYSDINLSKLFQAFSSLK